MNPEKNTAVLTEEESFLTEDMKRASNLFGTYNQVNALKEMRDQLQQRTISSFKEDGEDLSAKLSTTIEEYTVEQLNALTDDQITSIYETAAGEGKDIDFAIPFEDEKQEKEFKRSFLVFIREQDVANKELDETITQMEKTLSESKEELDEILTKHGSYSQLVYNNLKDQLATAEGEKKEKIEKMISALDESYTLDRVITYVDKYDQFNIVQDYKHRSDDVFTRYMKAVNKLKVTVDITKYADLEARFLGEEYAKYPNIFLFIIIRMYSYNKTPDNITDGLFLTQLLDNVRSLYSDTFGNDERKGTFITSIKTVLDTFYK